MDQITRVNTMKIAELRKILKDNGIKETSKKKVDLIYQATDVLLTNMAIKGLMEYDIQPSANDELIKDSKVKEESSVSELRKQQDREYEECLKIDQKITKEPNKETFEELSPMSLREKRLAYFQ